MQWRAVAPGLLFFALSALAPQYNVAVLLVKDVEDDEVFEVFVDVVPLEHEDVDELVLVLVLLDNADVFDVVDIYVFLHTVAFFCTAL